MSVSFSVEMSGSQLQNLANRINKSIENRAPLIAFTVVNELGKLDKVSKFRDFLRSVQFFSDFGIDPLSGVEMSDRFYSFFNKISTLNEHSIIFKRGHNIFFKLLDQNKIREDTTNIWAATPESTNNKAAILVNAWDVYEYGIIGSKNTNGRIPGYIERAAKGSVEKKISRSGISLMIPNQGRSFIFGKENAPRIMSIRGAILKNIDKIEKNSARFLTSLGKLGF